MPDIIGKVFTGKVTGITDFGAFVKLPGGKTGLVHISEISNEYVKDIKDHLQQNQIIRVKVLSIDDRGKIGLSIKKATADAGVAAGAGAVAGAADAGIMTLAAEAVIAVNGAAGEAAAHLVKPAEELAKMKTAASAVIAPSPAMVTLMATDIISRNANKAVIAQTRMPINRKQGKPADIFWNSREQATGLSFEERLSKYMKDSNEKLNDLKKNFEAKRGSGGYKKSSQNY